ncbi:MAG: hypothetical protein H6632_02085 [Anaerolineales bacterium]|nr:hypothetical protein [Anaerolineales bacterium]
MQPDKKILKTYIWLSLLSIIGVAWLQWPRLGDPYRVDEDFRTFYWFAKFQNPALFSHDPDQGMRYVEILRPWGKPFLTSIFSLGYDFLFYAAGFVFEPILFSKLLPFILMPITVLYVFEFGRLVRDHNTSLVLGIGFLLFNLAASSAVSVLNGLQRSFALTFMVVLLYYLQAQKYKSAVVATLVAALFYPPASVLMLATWGLAALPSLRLSHIGVWLQSRAVVHLGLAVILTGVILSASVIHLLGVFDAFTNPAQTAPEGLAEASDVKTEPSDSLFTNPVYGPGGSVELFYVFPLVGRGGIVDLGEDLINLLILLALSGLIVLVQGRAAFKLPQVVWAMLIATLVMFVAAWFVALIINNFLLYLPSRYTRVGLFLFLFLFFGVNIIDFVKEAPGLLRRNPRRLVWLVAGIELVILGLILFYPTESATISGLNMKWLLGLTGLLFSVLGVALYRRPPASPAQSSRPATLSPLTKGVIGLIGAICVIGWLTYASILTEVSYLNPPSEERALFNFLSTLPTDAVIAGTPCAINSVELFARRSVLFSCEQSHGDSRAIRTALMAYYAADTQTIGQFCAEYGVNYLVIDRQSYSPEYLAQNDIYFEPYNHELLSVIARQDRFILADLPDEIKLFQNGPIYVVECAQLNKVD